MNYSVKWGGKLVRVDYCGAIDNQDIESAHLELNGDGRFYECRHLILNVTDCNLDKVSVPELDLVIATDLGAAETNKSLKVAMVANDSVSFEKASDYISEFLLHKSPWKFEIFNSIKDAHAWFDA